MWSVVTNRVSVVPVTVMRTRATGVPDDDDVEVEVEELDDDVDEDEDDPPEEEVEDDDVPVEEGELEQADERAPAGGPRRKASHSRRPRGRDRGNTWPTVSRSPRPFKGCTL
jgi:hypothetical protein